MRSEKAHDVTHDGNTAPRDRYNPIKTIKTSFIGTMNMLGLAKRTKARFLLTSTSEVYGDPLVHPQARHTKMAKKPSTCAQGLDSSQRPLVTARVCLHHAPSRAKG